MEFFKKFAWAVPVAFSDAVGMCRFEEGDILYSARAGYDSWGVPQQDPVTILQVRYPSRAPLIADGEGERVRRGVFEKNWHSEVLLDIDKGGQWASHERVVTTQGRLYSCLWRGDLALLPVHADHPPMPVLVNKIAAQLVSAMGGAREDGRFPRLFLLPIDKTNSNSFGKYRKVISALCRHSDRPGHLVDPQTAGLENWNSIAPTVDIAVFSLSGLTWDETLELLRGAISPDTNRATSKKFSISRHGVLINRERGLCLI